MKLSKVLQLPTLKLILLLYEKGETRYTDLAAMISSRGTLSLSLKELEEERLLQRRVVTARPMQSYYSLTVTGRNIGAKLKAVAEMLEKSRAS